MRGTMAWETSSPTGRYEDVVLGAAVDLSRTLHLYGPHYERAVLAENMTAGMAITPTIVHHIRPWTRAVLKVVTDDSLEPTDHPTGEFAWYHITVLAAVLFALAVLAVNVAGHA